MSYDIHEKALCESAEVGPGTSVGPFSHILAGARIGADCSIGTNVVVERDVVLGDRVVVQSGTRLCDGLRIADEVSVGANVTFGDASAPGEDDGRANAQIEVAVGAAVGANATILPGVSIGRRAHVGAGAVVTQNVPPNAVVKGNPAHIVGYVDTRAEEGVAVRVSAGDLPVSRVPGVSVLRMTRADDLRGSLVAANFDGDLPFIPKRFFTVFGVPSANVRGEHAHRECHQLLVCVQGSLHAVVDNGSQRQEFVLDRADFGLHLGPMIWGTQYRQSPDAVLLVLASHPYDADDYIRSHDEFLAEVAGRTDGASRPVHLVSPAQAPLRLPAVASMTR